MAARAAESAAVFCCGVFAALNSVRVRLRSRIGERMPQVYQYDLAQKANDGDFYVMSEIDARLRELRRQFADEQKDR